MGFIKAVRVAAVHTKKTEDTHPALYFFIVLICRCCFPRCLDSIFQGEECSAISSS